MDAVFEGVIAGCGLALDSAGLEDFKELPRLSAACLAVGIGANLDLTLADVFGAAG
jgi:hypothetical protein